MSGSAEPEADARRREALVRKLTADAIGALDLISVYLGDRLGLYQALAEHPGATPSELAGAAELHPRYVREWLEQQTVSGILETPNPDAGDEQRRYRLPAGHDEVLLDESSLHFMASIADGFVSCIGPLETLVDAFRTGAGVPYAAYGAGDSQARGTRALYEQLLTSQWLPAIPGLHQRLCADPPARIADVACGHGHSTLAIARGYPKVMVDGIDLDAPSIQAARRLLIGSGVVATRSMPAGVRFFAKHQPFTPMIDTLRGLLFGTHIGSSAVVALAWCTGIGLLGLIWSIKAWGRDRAERPSG